MVVPPLVYFEVSQSSEFAEAFSFVLAYVGGILPWPTMGFVVGAVLAWRPLVAMTTRARLLTTSLTALITVLGAALELTYGGSSFARLVSFQMTGATAALTIAVIVACQRAGRPNSPL